MKTVEVNEESIKTSKKLLAEVNKRVDALEAERIRIKKELLEPYLEFEAKIKTITGVVKESDNELRSKVRELEELERQEKRRIIENMFEKRIGYYPTLFFLTSDRFIKPVHLNKTSALNKVEIELAQWLEQRKREVEVIGNTVGASLEKYAETLDLVSALPKDEPPAVTVDTPKKWVTFMIDEVNQTQVQLFLKMTGIPFAIN
jgi:DNA anti-recombination protein RmuC